MTLSFALHMKNALCLNHKHITCYECLDNLNFKYEGCQLVL